METVADTYGIEIIDGKGATERFLEDLERQKIEEKRNAKSIKNKKKALKKKNKNKRKANRKK